MLWITLLIILIIISLFIYFEVIKKDESDEVEDKVDSITITPNTTSRDPIKKALLVGINKYKPDLNADLRGCVNDVEMIRHLLINNFSFDPNNIRVIINERATQDNIIKRLQWLINDTKEGDVLVFHYSAHGSQIVDRNGDELDDHLDEILCPYDLDWDNPLSDDVLAELFSKIPKGVKLIMIADCCHSGTIVRELEHTNPRYLKARFILPPFDIRSRSLNKELSKQKLLSKAQSENQNVILLSACKDNQVAADAYINGKYNGALSWAVYTTLSTNSNVTYLELHKKVRNLLKKGGFTQDPQLSGPENLLSEKVFT